MRNLRFSEAQMMTYLKKRVKVWPRPGGICKNMAENLALRQQLISVTTYRRSCAKKIE